MGRTHICTRQPSLALPSLLSEAQPAIAAAFIDALQQGLAHIGHRPQNGSLRFAYELDIPELRTWPLTRYPYLVFYVEHERRVDVWRVLHMPLLGVLGQATSR